MNAAELFHRYVKWYNRDGRGLERLFYQIIILLCLYIVLQELHKPSQYALRICNVSGCYTVTGTLEELREKYPYEVYLAENGGGLLGVDYFPGSGNHS